MTAVLLCGIAALALWCTAIASGEASDDLTFGEWHHFHLGLALWLVGLLFSWRMPGWLGAALMMDDAIQHAGQRWWLGPASRISLFHWLYGQTFYRWTLIRKLNRWLDRLH